MVGKVDVIYMDFMKAFDQVPHRRLLRKVESYVISGNVPGWIDDFVFDRSQCVLANGSNSSLGRVTVEFPEAVFEAHSCL